MTVTPKCIEQIRQHNEDFNLALAGALLHNLGKASSKFIESMLDKSANGYLFQHIVGLLDADAPPPDRKGINWGPRDDLASSYNELDQSTRTLLSRCCISLPAPFDDRPYRIGDFIEYLGVGKKEPWYRKSQSNGKYNIENIFSEGSLLTHLMNRAHGAASGGEKHGIYYEQQNRGNNIWLATPFGWETKAKGCEVVAQGKTALDELRHKVEKIIGDHMGSQPGFSLEQFSQSLRPLLEEAVADTQRPINDISIWDIGHSGAAFLLALAIGLICRDQPIPHCQLAETDTSDSTDDHPASILQWRVLRIAFDGLGYLSSAAGMADVRVRQQLIEQALDRAQKGIEQAPLALEVYRDENGASFVFPYVTHDSSIFAEAENIIEAAFRDMDLSPNIVLSKNSLPLPPDRGDNQDLISTIKDELTRTPAGLEYQVDKIALSWQGGNSAREKCSACGLRPQGYGAAMVPEYQNREFYSKKAIKRNICCICMARRRGIAQGWLSDPNRETVWLDEVADNSGRLALITGSFDLDEFFDNHVYPSQNITCYNFKVVRSQSFARLRRVWESTEQFWREVNSVIHTTLPEKRRLQIEPVISDDVRKNLGDFHAYEFVLTESVKMNVVWDPEYKDGQGRFVSADNIERLEDRLKGDGSANSGRLVAYLKDKMIMIEEPGGYGGNANKLGEILIREAGVINGFDYRPAVSILNRPRHFMLLVPAASAWDTARLIKEKYEREMGKVQNRLPLQLGLVFAHHRTPVRAILDAGVRMMNRKRAAGDKWEVVKTQDIPQGDLKEEQKFLCCSNKHYTESRAVTLIQNRSGKKTTWYVPKKMGDGEQDDIWYPLVTRIASGDGSADEGTEGRNRATDERKKTYEHVLCLGAGNAIHFAPSSLDWIWLDSSGRRFEVAYDDGGARLDPEQGHRPYLLDEMEIIDKIWNTLSAGLSRGQLYGIRALVDEKRREWLSDETQESKNIFRQFCQDSLVNLEWRKGHKDWPKVTGMTLEELTDHAISGLLSDTVELYLQILKTKLEQEEKERAHE